MYMAAKVDVQNLSRLIHTKMKNYSCSKFSKMDELIPFLKSWPFSLDMPLQKYV
jgi:hypothetical protein